VSNYLPTFANVDPAFEPGKKFLYSNSGYNLLGAIIEKASGQSYYDYVRDHIFKPAGMNNTDNYDLDTDVPNLACGYMSEPDGRRRNNIYRLPVRGIPCGLGYSTAPDMLKFDIALRNHTLLRERSLKELWTSRIDNKRSGQYGYGCQIRQYAGTRVIWHGGGFVGITNQFEIYPELGYTVVILNNIDSNPLGLVRKVREWIVQGTM
jgi:CubicO group peptidase (beta-lactamase class C family)